MFGSEPKEKLACWKFAGKYRYAYVTGVQLFRWTCFSLLTCVADAGQQWRKLRLDAANLRWEDYFLGGRTFLESSAPDSGIRNPLVFL